jgi:hypothetical protein
MPKKDDNRYRFNGYNYSAKTWTGERDRAGKMHGSGVLSDGYSTTMCANMCHGVVQGCFLKKEGGESTTLGAISDYSDERIDGCTIVFFNEDPEAHPITLDYYRDGEFWSHNPGTVIIICNHHIITIIMVFIK